MTAVLSEWKHWANGCKRSDVPPRQDGRVLCLPFGKHYLIPHGDCAGHRFAVGKRYIAGHN